MRRRALLTTITAVVGTAGISGTSALAEVVRHGLLDAAGAVDDWDAVVTDYARQLVTAPSPQYGEAVLAQLMVARSQSIDLGTTPARLRAIAQLGQLYGLWLGNQGDVASARGWYRSAAMVADRSGDPSTRTYVRGRALSRGVWEGGTTVRETVTGVERTLAITKTPTFGALESLSALVCVHGYTGNLTAGRTVVKNMRRLADRLPEAEAGKVAGPTERAAIFGNFLECRLGSRRSAEKAYAEAMAATSAIPLWQAEAKIYYARALVRDGDLDDGIRFGLDTARAFDHDLRVIGLDVQDLLASVPDGYQSDELDELRTYATTGPAPWEILR